MPIDTMEPPPLLLPGDISLTEAAPASVRAMGEASHLIFVPDQSISTGAGVLVLFFGIIALAELAAGDQAAHERHRKLAETAMPLEEVFAAQGTWSPTIVAVKEVARQLEMAGTLQIKLKEGMAMMPGVIDRSPTVYMENWLAPIRAWYNDDRTTFDYGKMNGFDADAVLEIGLVNYEFYADHFLIQFMFKLVDPRTGAIIARSREHTYQTVGMPSKLFVDEGKPFKQVFSNLTKLLVSKALKNIGLLDPSAPSER